MDLPSLLQSFAETTGLDDLRLDGDGQCTILFDNQHEVTFSSNPDDHSILLFAEIGSAKGLGLNECRTLLSASLLGAETAGAALAIHDTLGKVVLWKRCDGDHLEAGDFTREINTFLGAVMMWKERLGKISSGAESSFIPSSSVGNSFDFFHV